LTLDSNNKVLKTLDTGVNGDFDIHTVLTIASALAAAAAAAVAPLQNWRWRRLSEYNEKEIVGQWKERGSVRA
jgi:exosome complex RNA-binding protein Rrp42 (RNase PH superfamily)